MKISKFNHKEFSDAQIVKAYEKGELIVSGLGFFERITLAIVNAIRESRTKSKKRIEALEKEVAELKKAVALLNGKPVQEAETAKPA